MGQFDDGRETGIAQLLCSWLTIEHLLDVDMDGT